MKKWFKGITTCAVLSSICSGPIARAAIPRLSTTVSTIITHHSVEHLDLMCHDDFAKGMNASIIQPMNSLNTTSQQDVAQFIPSDIVPSGDGGYVASHIIDHSLSSFFNSPGFRTSDFGRRAVKAEQSMEGNIEMGGNKPNEIKHELKFAMQPTQTRAVIEYKGLTNAELSYQVAASTMNFEIHERVHAISSQLVYNHIVKPGDATDSVSLRWVW